LACVECSFVKTFNALRTVLAKETRMTDAKPRTADLVARYAALTKEIMPQLARSTHKHWPVRNDHCFQRIVLDAVCGGVWYDHLPRPAYKHLTQEQALCAVKLCDDIVSGDADLVAMNRQSLIWREKLR
jgi:hypothetical protein